MKFFFVVLAHDSICLLVISKKCKGLLYFMRKIYDDEDHQQNREDQCIRYTVAWRDQQRKRAKLKSQGTEIVIRRITFISAWVDPIYYLFGSKIKNRISFLLFTPQRHSKNFQWKSGLTFPHFIFNMPSTLGVCEPPPWYAYIHFFSEHVSKSVSNNWGQYCVLLSLLDIYIELSCCCRCWP